MKRLRHVLLAALLLASLGTWVALVLLERSYREPENYSLIEDGLYLGGDVERPPPGTTATLNLCEIPDSYRTDVHLHESIRDAAPAPDLAWLRRMVEFVDTQRRAGGTTYVHCRQGVSRSGMVVVAYVMFKNQWTRDDALAFVRKGRPLTRPNPAFMERLLQWECALQCLAAENRRDERKR